MGTGFLAALATLAGPIAARVLMALGMSVVTIGGVTVALSSVKGSIIGNLGGAPYAALQLAGLMGCWEGLGLIFGAMTFTVSFWSLTQATSILGKA
ncbi:MAG: DUF2523 domain-containing protein [Vitreoscilla sp.]|nr:DUF2523 domain-containing protein [Vitreoscilla sp.]